MKRIIGSFICVILSLYISSKISAVIRPFIEDTYLQGCLSELVLTVLAIVLLAAFKRLDVLKFKFKGFATGLKVGAVLVVDILLLIIVYLAVGDVNGNRSVNASVMQVFFFITEMLLVGVAEEALYRGLIQNEVMDYIGSNSVGQIRIVIVIAGILFGMSHLLNAINPSVGFGSALVQAIVAVPIGILFGTIYYRSKKNLWVGILLHALIDGASFVLIGTLSGVSQAEAIGSFTAVNLVPFFIYFVVDCWVLRRKKLEEELLA